MAVYIKTQQDAIEKGLKETIVRQICGDAPYELALRFAGCNLRCGACFAAGYSWSEKFKLHNDVKQDIPINELVSDFNSKPQPTGKNYNWLRILGGEPLLNDEYVKYLFQMLKEVVRADSKKINNGIVIQTNGIWLGKGKTQEFEKSMKELCEINPNISVAVEISIKGSNPEEFEFITRLPSSLFKDNLQCYYNLLEMNIPQLRAVPVAGFGINETLLKNGKSKSRITVMIDKTPCFHPSRWNDEFRKLYDDSTLRNQKYNQIFSKMPMHGFIDFGNVAEYSMKLGRNEYGNAWYENRNYNMVSDPALNKKFADILEKFFLVDFQTYYWSMLH